MLSFIRVRTLSMSCSVNAAKKKPLMDLTYITRTTNIDRAFEHFDDLYSSVYGKKWPSIRLGLLCPQKYIAVANSFSDVDSISKRLEGQCAFDLRDLWNRGKAKLNRTADTRKTSQEESESIEVLDETLHAIAKTKVAEEMDTLYQNVPAGRMPGPVFVEEEDNRLIRHVQDASTALVPPSRLKGTEDYEFESEYFAEYAQAAKSPLSDFTFTTPANAPTIRFPYLRPYTYEGGSGNNFPAAPRNKHTGLREWICINGASLAPIIALDLCPEVNMLDLCAGPGTKSLLALMTMCPATLTANDLEATRLSRVRRLFLEFTGSSTPNNVRFTRQNAAVNFPGSPDFERVLADVPCSSDRISATVSENSLFQPRRMRERLNLVKTQKGILLSAFRSLSKTPGSVCVYSTCTLSPIENDGAVGAALRETDERDLVVDVEGLWKSLVPLQAMDLLFLSRTKFGVLVEPNVFANSGPMFISRILRNPFRSHQTVAE